MRTQVVHPHRRIDEDHFCGGRRRGGATRSGSLPPRSIRRRAASRSISALSASRTSADFSLRPVNACASATSSSSRAIVVRTCTSHARGTYIASIDAVRACRLFQDALLDMATPVLPDTRDARGRRRTGRGRAAGSEAPCRVRSLVLQRSVEMIVLSRHPAAGDRGDPLGGEILGRKRPAHEVFVPLQFLILDGRHEVARGATVAGHGDRLALSDLAILSEIASKLRRGHFAHGSSLSSAEFT